MIRLDQPILPVLDFEVHILRTALGHRTQIIIAGGVFSLKALVERFEEQETNLAFMHSNK